MNEKRPPADLRLHAPPELAAHLEHGIRTASTLHSAADRIVFLSGLLLDAPYHENPLGGGPGLPENIFVDLHGVDCFTLLDVVEAMRRCHSYEEMPDVLAQVRYSDRRISYETRNHFYSDWLRNNTLWISNMTATVGGPLTENVKKRLNRKADASAWVPGIPDRDAELDFIPSSAVNEEILGKIQSGDYIGLYAESEGLDVTHVGIFIREGGSASLRHASSVHRKVLDEAFENYVAHKPGILVYRPTDPGAVR